MIKVLIIEDDPNISEYLVGLLSRNFADVKVMAICDTVSRSLEAINLHNPDLVFMDVELHTPETGFDILRKLASIHFKIIFTTAYNEYAIQAIKFSAIDYLLKPINEEELREAVKKFIQDRNVSNLSQRDSLLSYQQDYHEAKIGLPTLNGYNLVPVQNVLYCKGESAQSMVFMTGNQKELVNRTLKECEEILEKFGFCRIHKSYLVNLHFVQKYFKGDGGYVLLTEGSKLDVSKNYKDILLSRLNKM